MTLACGPASSARGRTRGCGGRVHAGRRL